MYIHIKTWISVIINISICMEPAENSRIILKNIEHWAGHYFEKRYESIEPDTILKNDTIVLSRTLYWKTIREYWAGQYTEKRYESIKPEIILKNITSVLSRTLYWQTVWYWAGHCTENGTRLLSRTYEPDIILKNVTTLTELSVNYVSVSRHWQHNMITARIFWIDSSLQSLN